MCRQPGCAGSAGRLGFCAACFVRYHRRRARDRARLDALTCQLLRHAGRLWPGWPADAWPLLARNLAAQLLWDPGPEGGGQPCQAAGSATLADILAEEEAA